MHEKLYIGTNPYIYINKWSMNIYEEYVWIYSWMYESIKAWMYVVMYEWMYVWKHESMSAYTYMHEW